VDDLRIDAGVVGDIIAKKRCSGIQTLFSESRSGINRSPEFGRSLPRPYLANCAVFSSERNGGSAGSSAYSSAFNNLANKTQEILRRGARAQMGLQLRIEFGSAALSMRR